VDGARAYHNKEAERGIVMITPWVRLGSGAIPDALHRQMYHLGELPTSWGACATTSERFHISTAEDLIDHQTGHIRSRPVYPWEPQPDPPRVLLPGDVGYTIEKPPGFPEVADPTARHRGYSLQAAKGQARNIGAERTGLLSALGLGYQDFKCGVEQIEDNAAPQAKL
jgi:hypothetical protein